MNGTLVLIGSDGGDFAEFCTQNKLPLEVTANAEEAFEHAGKSGGIILPAGNFPVPSPVPAAWKKAAERGVHMFIECPERLDGIEFSSPVRRTVFERTVAMPGARIPGLPENTILLQHGSCVRTVTTRVEPWLAASRVAGYRRAVFGIDGETIPLLFTHPDYPNVLVSNTRFSNFITARFAPQCDWLKVIGAIIGFLLPRCRISNPDYRMAVRPYFRDHAPIIHSDERAAMLRNLKFMNDQMLTRVHEHGMGVAEGFDSEIGCDGSQLRRTLNRSDCTGEVGLALALAWRATGNLFWRDYASGILDGMFSADNRWADPASPLYGQFRFYERNQACYASGNGRSCLSALVAGELLGKNAWDRDCLINLLTSWRLTGENGFRRPRFDDPESFREHPAEFYRNEDFVHLSPHYQASHLAAFLAGWKLTGFAGFRDSAEHAAGLLMTSYPKLRWTNGQSQEVARLVMLLAWLVRAEATPAHLEYLDRVIADVKRLMQPCGAVAEEMGDLSMGDFPAPQSNAAYGTTEAALIQSNGDPACDLLYTANYMLIGLHEAAAACPDRPEYRELEDRLCRFICRIQVHSTVRPELDGAWMRGFDWELWEYFGSSADTGWGAWSIESGWTNSWISSTLALRGLGMSLWDMMPAGKLAGLLPEALAELDRQPRSR